ncbi:AAA family ATPase [Catellatospora methionotrophica]|uniref:AAA family ATPase n=1 Tax=Catellatospora methionotrophica TaxID=121620 RepID=UPI00140AB943|nr:AAA family ATPase [Catellatospora methionotrophica]
MREARKAARNAQEVAEQRGIEAEPAELPGADLPLTTAQELWTEASRVAGVYRKALQILERDTENLARERDQLQAKTAKQDQDQAGLVRDTLQLAADQARLAADRADLEKELAALRRRTQEVAEWAAQTRQERIDSAAGFMDLERQHQRRLDEQRAAMDQDIDRSRAEAASAVARERSELDELRQHSATELEAQRAELEEQRRALRSEQNMLRAMAENEQENEDLARQRAELAVAAELQRRQLKIDQLTQTHETVKAHADRLREELDRRDAAARDAGHEDPARLQQQIRLLNEDNSRLRAQLANSLTIEDQQLITRLREDNALQAQQILALEHQCASLRTENNLYLISTTEVEELREHRDHLQHSISTHRKLLREKQEEVDSLLGGERAPRPFPGLDELDAEPGLQTARPTNRKTPDLDDLLDHIQRHIHADRILSSASSPLSFDKRDLRCLLGGLAMSRLHLLQGISGIGKTSLPKAFARAIGADYAVVEVQAGWRDRADLVGHLNAFERRYYETTFTKAVYQAGCAAHQDRPFFVILDEMNLAHPEQYFADILSGLENTGEQIRLQLSNQVLEPAPQHLSRQRGTHLPVPPNVWFFGTSNHDETTVQFADKTYDRANVIELPATPPAISPQPPQQRQPVSLKALEDAFDRAHRQHGDASEQILHFLREHLVQPMRDDFKLGWGPRLERQIRGYAPVVVAAGGSVGEAADHVIATRIVRKLRNRYALKDSDLRSLRNIVESSWPSLVRGTVTADNGPTATLALLDELAEARG